MRFLLAFAIVIASPAVSVAAPAECALDEPPPPESAGCAVRPGVGALASFGLSIVALGLSMRRRSGPR